MFRIRAVQLGAADGWVRCGNCGETFYALERLYDAPVKLPSLHERPEQRAAGQAEAQTPPPGLPDSAPGEHKEESAPQPELPPVLQNAPEESGRLSSRYVWAGMITVMSLVALVQVAWFNRDRLLYEYPQSVPWVEKLCERLQCDVIRFRDPSAIKLLYREVRMHPRYLNALQVSATIVNQAESIQPYPEIELVIYDTNGQVISHGRFTPAEYLKAGTNPAAGMPPDLPVSFVLGLSGMVREAASFAFQFY